MNAHATATVRRAWPLTARRGQAAPLGAASATASSWPGGA